MVSIRLDRDCPNCQGGELWYLLAENPSTKEQKVILESESFAWAENIYGTKWCVGSTNVVIPANKQDLIRLHL